MWTGSPNWCDQTDGPVEMSGVGVYGVGVYGVGVCGVGVYGVEVEVLSGRRRKRGFWLPLVD